MEPGRLSKRITLLRVAEKTASSGAGTAIQGLTPIADVWAEVTPISGRESFASNQRFAEVDVRFRIRWRKLVSPIAAIRYDSGDGAGARDFDVVEVIEIGRREGFDVLATARAE